MPLEMTRTTQNSTIAQEINAGTRSLHDELNRRITSRLRFCLPPHASTPEIYTGGFARFAQIYLAFEGVWDEIIHSFNEVKPEDSWIDVEPYEQLLTNRPRSSSDGLMRILRSLRPDGLARSERIRDDLSVLLKVLPSELDTRLEELTSETMTRWRQHIQEKARRKPHVLIAYAWTLYMAVFSGGRWIRGELVGAGEDFWLADSLSHHKKRSVSDEGEYLEKNSGLTESFEALGLSFWFHPGHSDGDDIKADFKSNMHAINASLTRAQRNDVVEEAQDIFAWCRSLVEELDDTAGPQRGDSGVKVRSSFDSRRAGSMSALRWYAVWAPLMLTSAAGLGWLTLASASRLSDAFLAP